GTLAYEERYLATYASSPASLVVIARDGDRLVGASTALPLVVHADVAPALVGAGYAAEAVCYFGESVLERAARGRGVGGAFFEHREAHARRQGFLTAAFCAVERPAAHPRRPVDYQPPGTLWARHGFRRRPEITTTMTWRDVDGEAETAKPMVFWTKELR
ncbi:MAG: GNAT family N-acetyltransferase, partial [Proteobacteria bacterium]|nr:GNAT family N-acetyltransferase [Pseudomonadota bacterium]